MKREKILPGAGNGHFLPFDKPFDHPFYLLLTTVAVYGASPVIGYTSQQMSVGGTQPLTVFRGLRRRTRGPSSAAGDPLRSIRNLGDLYRSRSNPNCQANAAIRCLDSCGESTEITIAVNVPQRRDAYFSYPGGCYQNVPAGQPTLCGNITPSSPAGAYYFGCLCVEVHRCDGSLRYGDAIGNVVFEHLE